MLQERVRRWPERWKREGRAEGLAEGRQAGLQEGRQEGRLETLMHQRRGLVRQTQKRFGAEVATLASDWLDAIADAQRLEELAEAFLDCTSGEQWLEQIGRPLN